MKTWRTPGVVLLCGGIILTLAMGTRQGFGLFLQPMTLDHGWTRETFAFALALQNLIWGISQPFFGMIADRKGAGRVLVTGAVLYTIGLILMALAGTGWQFSLATGLFIGLAQGCTTFSIVFGVVSRIFPPERRSMALGLCSAAGSFGQFAMLPYTGSLISNFGWFHTLLILSVSAALIAPLASALVETRGKAAAAMTQSVGEAVREAFGHKSFLLLTAGYFVCGFQLAFITVHFPAYLVDRGLPANIGMMALALVGLFNIFGSFASGALGAKYTKKYLLSSIYFTRSIVIALFVFSPVSEGSVYLFSAAIGLLWLSTVPLTNGVIGGIFGVAYMSTLSGFVFLSHQMGSFIGVWLGGYLFDHTGSYNVVWMISIGLGIFAALVNLPIQERPIVRAPAPTPAG
ncbi:MAG TPA: MFS transporter [Burkholderiales bacterium]|jgi:MFS family permease|nr:MFS transporter [Burkholderiales bacterium]